jgi:hypothetical protein
MTVHRRCRTGAIPALAGGPTAPAWIPGSHFASLRLPENDESGGGRANLDRFALSGRGIRRPRCLSHFSAPNLIHALPASLILRRSLSPGRYVATAVWRKGTGASVARLTQPCGRGGSAIRLPWGHYDPCVWR